MDQFQCRCSWLNLLLCCFAHLKAYESFSFSDPLKSNKALETRVWLQPTKQKDRQSFNIDSASKRCAEWQRKKSGSTRIIIFHLTIEVPITPYCIQKKRSKRTHKLYKIYNYDHLRQLTSCQASLQQRAGCVRYGDLVAAATRGSAVLS